MKRQAAVLISGASGGIGRALCEAFSAAGYFVVATDRRRRRVHSDCFIAMDLRELVHDAAVRRRFRAEVIRAVAGRSLATLVNNAAIQVLGSVAELTPAAFTGTMDVNVAAPFLLVKLFLPQLRRNHGSVINIGSIHSGLTKPRFAAYAASKSALLGLTRALAVELGPHDVRVNLIRPAATRTDMLLAGFRGRARKFRALADCHPQRRIAEPHEIADVAVFLASDRASFINGAAIDVDGGISARLHDPG